MENKQLSKKFWAIGLLLVFMLGISNNGTAQSSSQVTITGIPSILPTPFADDIENNFATGRYQVIFNYTSQVNQPVDFVFDFVVKKDNRTIVDIQSEPTAFTPGSYVFINFFEELVFPQSSDEVLRSLPREIQNQMIQSGVVPEGRYTIEIEANPVAQRTMSIIPGFANFSVRYPPPPILVSPSRESNVTQEVPIFAWTPVVSTRGRVIEYDFLLVEVFDGQTPLQAIEGNRAIAEQTLVGGTTLPYTFEFLPLEEGSRYAWQITARDGAGEMPLQDDGESEIYTFIYREIEEVPLTDVQDIDEIVLIPGFARLIDLSGVTPSASVDAFDLTGPALLELDFEEFGTLETMVNINLLVQPQTAGSPMVLGGNVEGAADILENILLDENPWIEFEELFWSFGDQFRVDLSMLTPAQQWFEADGELILTRRGLSGIAELYGDPLAEYNSEYLDVIVNAVGVEFPGNRFWADGDARVMGFETPCELRNFNMLDGIIEAGILCDERLNIPLVDNSEFLTMQVNRVRGDIQILPDISDFNFSVDVQSLVGMQTLEGRYCGANTNMNISSDGLNIQTGHSRCALFNPRIDLGFAEVRFENTDLSFLEYDSVAEQWDFELTFDGNLEVPAFDNWSSLTMTGIGVTPDGISFESIEFGDNENLNPLPSFDAQILEITLESFGLNEFTFPIFDWDEQAPGPWEIDFEGSAMVQSGTGVPMCLLGTSLEATNGRVDQGRVISNLELGDFEGCSWEIGPGYEIQVDALSGIAGVDYPGPDEIQPFGNVNLSGGISLGYPFDCGDEMFSFSGDDLILSDGIQGTLTNVVPQCPLNVGPFTAQVTSSDVEFSVNDQGAQQAIMSADAFVQLPDGLQVQGSVVINLMTGEFLDVSFIIDEPFDWNIPSDENPVLTFRLNRAEINQNGFLVDGRHRFMLPNSQMGVTFDNLLIDLNTFSIQSGRIIFDEEFAFEVGIADNLADLSFQAVEMDSELTLDPGLLMELSGNIQIDSLGVHSSGSAEASLAFSGRNYDSLVTVEYTDDFRLGLYPFSVTSGQADFYFDGDRFAYVDPSGFNPVMAFFAEYLVPERLPLPTEDIAYLQLRDDDDLLVDVTEDENGNLQISTIPGQALSLVVPYIDPDSPPTLADVTIEDLTISANPYSPEVLYGSITADVPTDDPAFTLTDRNVPVSVETIQFGNRNVNGSSITALYMMGNLHLFDQEVKDENKVEFYLRGDGYVRAAFDISGMDSQFSIAPQDRVIVGVDALSGSFDMPIGSGSPNYDFSVGGSMEILTDEGYRAGADLTIRTESGGFFTIEDFNGYAFDESPGIGIGNFNLNLEEIVSIPEFSYSSQDGFEFAISLNLDFDIQLSEDRQITFPLNEIEIRHDGVYFPGLLVDESSAPGLDLPEIELGGFGFKPLALNLQTGFTYSWEDGADFNPDILIDFAVDLPDFEDTGLNPPDGILLTDIGFDEGFLTGGANIPFNDIEIPIAPGDVSPTLLVEEMTVALAKVPDNSFRQAIDFDINGTIENIPAFTVEDPAECPDAAEYSLAIIEGRAFEGSISNVQPCGYLELGPVTLEVPNADLQLFLDGDEQRAELDGAVDVTLPTPGDGQPPTVISGGLVLDAITGTIHDGFVNIDQPFGLNMPYFEDDDPLFTFGINQATLDSQGLTLTGSGNLEKGPVNASVSFDELTIGLHDFDIAGGSATIDADFSVLFDVNPFGFQLISEGESLPAANALLMDLDAQVVLNEHGLNLTGAADANLIYQDEQYTNLRVELVDNFAMSITGLSVSRGQAEFYWDEDGQEAEFPIAIIDENGFHFGSGLLAFLPDRIPLPTEDIAYIDVKDDEGNPLVEVESTDQGMTITTDGDYLTLVVPALSNQDGDNFEAGVSFTLQTDDAYNVTGGSLTLQSNYSLEDRLNLPVTLTDLNLEDDEGISLEIGLSFDLPAVFEGHEAAVFAKLSQDGVESGSFSVGEVGTTYDSTLDPLYTFDYAGSVPGSGETDTFEANLMGVEATFGSNSVSFAGTIGSSLVLNEGDDPLFFNASWSDESWEFSLDPGDVLDEMRLGQTTFSLDDYEPLELVSNEDNFYLNINGQVSFEDVLEEDILISVQDLQVGISNYQTSPSLHFALGQAVGELGNQQFDLFEGALSMKLIDPAITLSGRDLAISTDGNIGFLDQQIDYEGLLISTSGQFELEQAEISEVEIFDEYLVLQSFELSFDDGARVDSEIRLQLPAPVEEYEAVGGLSLYYDDGELEVDNAGLEFDLDDRFELFNFGEFELTKVRAEIDPFNWDQTGVYANGNIYLPNEPDPVIEFGDAANFPNNPGIGLTYSQADQVRVHYDITGNASFEFDLSFFRIDITANMNTTSGAGFEIQLGGEADLTLEAVEASLTYDGIVVTEEGLTDYGNLEEGSIDIIGVASLKVGKFLHKSDENGFTIQVADTQERDAEELQQEGDFESDDVEVNTINVEELLCFGPCPAVDDEEGISGGTALKLTIGGDTGADNGGIGGGVDRVMFYRTTDGLTSLTVENANISIDNIFEMRASINYEQDDTGVLLRAAAVGSFEIGDSEGVSAVVAGKFSNMGGDLSFGLFVAVETTAGIPIVPGVVTLTGAGGGFFYNPVQEDLDMVHESIGYFGHELVNEDAASIQGDTDFAVMLYASVAIAGSGGPSVVQGSTFFQITNQSFYMDARGSVLGMDGEDTIANTEITGAVSASVQRDPFAILVGIEVNANVPVILNGSGNIEFFMAGEGDDRVWGIIGDVEFGIYGDIFDGDAELLAGNPGFMFEITLSVSLDIKIIDFESSLTGSVWVLRETDDFSPDFPFGAYAEVSVEATVLKLVTVSATAQGIFVTRQAGGYEIFATAYGCVRVIKTKCGSAWASYSYQDGADWGKDAGEHAYLVDQVKDQQDDFRDHINSLLSELDEAIAAMNQPPPLSDLISDAEDARKAGYEFYNMPQNRRFQWEGLIHSPGVWSDLPDQLRDVRSEVMRSTAPNYPSPYSQKAELEKHRIEAAQIMHQLKGVVEQDLITAYEFEAAAEDARDQMVQSLISSPVSNVIKPSPSTEASQGVDFQVDDNQAGDQINNVQEFHEEVQRLDELIQEDIQAIQNNLDEMTDMLHTGRYSGDEASSFLDDVPTWLQQDMQFYQQGFQFQNFDFGMKYNNTYDYNAQAGSGEEIHLIEMASRYGDMYQMLERYFALDANRAWNEYFWAENHLNYMQQNSSQVNSAVQEISSQFQMYLQSAFIQQINPNLSVSDDLKNSLIDEATKLANRENFIYWLNARPSGQPILPSPDASPAPVTVREIYNRFTYSLPSNLYEELGAINTINHNFWYEFNHGGLQELRNNRRDLVMQVLLQNVSDYKDDVLTPLNNITLILDEFYMIRANITATLYNIIDEYLEWRAEVVESDEFGDLGADEDFLDEDDEVFYGEYRDNLADQLIPPQITDITVSPNRPSNDNVDTYYNETLIEWEATHPDEIIETSVNVRYPGFFNTSDETDIATGIDEYLSIGDRNSFTAHPHFTLFYNGEISFGIRVRGSAGNTAVRRANFRVDVGAGTTSNVEPGESVVPEETSPPDAPVIALHERYNSSESDGSTVYWTSLPENIDLVITAHDPEVGIGEWEYAVGTEPGTTDVIDWSLLQGQVEFDSDIPAHRISATTRMIDMVPGEHYYISARVTNTMGQVSPVTELQDPVVYDNTIPGNIDLQFMQPMIAVLQFFGPTVYPVIESVPEFNPTFGEVQSWSETTGEPRVQFSSITADDEGSGIELYEYVLTREEESPQQLFDSGNYEEHVSGILSIEGEMSDFRSSSGDVLDSFQREVYLHIRAVDRAGNRSEIYTFGPHTSIDHTAPKPGKLQAKLDGDNLRLYIIDVPYDPESDLIGIQYSIGSSADEMDIRSWPDENSVDKNWNQQSTEILNGSYQPEQSFDVMAQQNPRSQQSSSVTRYITIPTEDLPVGDNIYIRYRSVNTKGVKSSIRATGPINLDTTPPLVPDVNVSVNSNTRKIELDVGNITDPESGVKKLEYWVERAFTQSNLFSGGTFTSWVSEISSRQFGFIFNVNHGVLSRSTISPALSDGYDLTDFRVRVRITNGAGLTRTRTIYITDNDIYTPINLQSTVQFTF